MADIKELGIFGANKGLEKMKKEAVSKSIDSSKSETNKNNSRQKKNSATQIKQKKQSASKGKKNRPVGPPIRKFDRIYAAKQPLKLSPLLNATSRILVEKYETDISRDELLRQALDEYIKQNLSQEDKLDLFNDVLKDLDIFRTAKPENATVPELDENGDTIRTAEEIESSTEKDIIRRWGLNKK